MSRMPLATSAGNGTTTMSTAPSNTALFLTNLRLLNLDQLADWPSVTVQTFSTKDANQNQKQRIRCVEWALFRLFQLWDPEEAREKLQPFFPPLEPLQSLNLRAALYKCLNELKKNGNLGRETTLRKTMLDDCAGTKLHEVLAVFSTNVVRACLVEIDRHGSLTITKRLATAQALDAHSQRSLLPLATAHKASLTALLRRKSALRVRCASLTAQLDVAGQELQVREVASRQAGRRQPPPDFDALSTQLRDSWVGNAGWADLMLHGEAPAADQLLARHFNGVWTAISNGREVQSTGSESGLQARLEQRIQRQKRRVAKWQAFQDKLRGQNPRADIHEVPEQRSKFMFDAHIGLRIGNEATNHARDGPNGSGHASQSYSSILQSMREQLNLVSTVSKSRSRDEGNGANFDVLEERVISPRNRLSASFENLSTPPAQKHTAGPFRYTKALVSPSLSPETDAGDLDIADKRCVTTEGTPAQHSPRSPQTPAHRPEETSQRDEHTDNLGDGSLHSNSEAFIDGVQSRPANVGPQTPPEAAPEVTIAARIVALIPDETPRPPDNTQLRQLTLAERTRLSMAPRVSHDRGISVPLASVAKHEDHSTPDEELTEHSGFDRRASLLDRTRQSIALLPTGDAKSMHKPRKSMNAKPARRTSAFPVNQFETPRRAPSLTLTEMVGEDDSTQSTPRDKLFSGEAQYDSVFRSRPKIALSPAGTPQEDESVLDRNSGLDLDGNFASSPLSRLG